MNQEELRRFVNTDMFRQGSGDSGGEKGEIRDFMPSGSENISPRYLTNTLVKRKQSRNQKRSVSRGSSRGGTPDSTLKRFNPRTEGFRHLFNAARRLHLNSDCGKIAWNEIRNLYRKETGRHLNSEELNLICGTAHQTKNDLLSDQLSVIFEAVDSKGLIVRLNTTNTPPSIAEELEISPSAPISPQNLPAEENTKSMEEKRKEITENLIRRGLLTSDGRRPSATDSESNSIKESAEEPSITSDDHVETKEESSQIEINDIDAVVIQEVNRQEDQNKEENRAEITTPTERNNKEENEGATDKKENEEENPETTEVDLEVISQGPTNDNDTMEVSTFVPMEFPMKSSETENEDNEEKVPEVITEEQTKDELMEAEEASEETEKVDLTLDLQTENDVTDKEAGETKSVYENVIDGDVELEEPTDSEVTVQVEMIMEEERNEAEELVSTIKIEDKSEESATFEPLEEKNFIAESELKESPEQTTSDVIITISEVTQEMELEKDQREEEIAQFVVKELTMDTSAERSEKEFVEEVVEHAENTSESNETKLEIEKEIAVTEEPPVVLENVHSEVDSPHRVNTFEAQKPVTSESSYTTVTLEVELSKKFECVTTASFTPEKENVVVCHFERKIEKPVVPVTTEILSVEMEDPCVLTSSSIPELSPTAELEQRPMNITVVSSGALSPAGAPSKKEKKVRIRLPRRRIFGCCSIF